MQVKILFVFQHACTSQTESKTLQPVQIHLAVQRKRDKNTFEYNEQNMNFKTT